jgi:hypothetical protein
MEGRTTMELSTITMERTEAREKFLEYKRSVQARHDAEDYAIMQGYRALAAGKQLINLVETIQAGGLDDQKHPRLAVCRANEQWCRLETSMNGSVTFIGTTVAEEQAHRWVSHRSEKRRVRLEEGTFDEMPYRRPWNHEPVRAMVPMVPPGLRPRHALSNYHILWEAEWEKAPPVDPALLKHIGGDLYAVLVVWDLTELERTVLRGRVKQLP